MPSCQGVSICLVKILPTFWKIKKYVSIDFSPMRFQHFLEFQQCCFSAVDFFMEDFGLVQHVKHLNHKFGVLRNHGTSSGEIRVIVKSNSFPTQSDLSQMPFFQVAGKKINIRSHQQNGLKSVVENIGRFCFLQFHFKFLNVVCLYVLTGIYNQYSVKLNMFFKKVALASFNS